MSEPTSPTGRLSSTRGSASASTPATPASCFRSLVIYNPNLSQGKEERAMDNILFYYPPTVHPNRQMNHIGMCIAVMCFTERFQTNGASQIEADEIRTDHRCITVFSPVQEYYMALEADELYDASIVTPLLRKAFAAFTIRHGVALFCDPTRSDESQAVMKSFFTNFCIFMETIVMNPSLDGKPPLPAASGAVMPSPMSTAGSVNGNVEYSPPSSRTNRTTNKIGEDRLQRWQVEALSESLLHSPLRLQSTTTYQHQTCASIISQYLSMITSQCPRSSPDFIAQWKDRDVENGSFACAGDVRSAASTTPPPQCGDRDEDGSPRPESPTSAHRGANSAEVVPRLPLDMIHADCYASQSEVLCSVDRCAWSGIRCLLLRREDRRLLMSTCGDYLSTHLAYLSMIEPGLCSFIVRDEEVPSCCKAGCGLSNVILPLQEQQRSSGEGGSGAFCCVHAVDDIIVFLLVEDAVQAQLFNSIEVVATQLARELSEWLRCGTCALMRQSAPSATSLLAMCGASGSASASGYSPRRASRPSSSAVDRSLMLQQPQLLGTPSSSAMNTALRDGSSWVCWNHNVVHGAVFAHYPRLVQWTLGSLMREAIQSIAQFQKDALWESANDRSPRGHSGKDTGGAAKKEWASQVERKYALGRRFVECWVPLGADGWLYVCQRNGRVVGVPYYASPSSGLSYLFECFEIADKTTQRLFHGAHFLAPSALANAA